MSVTLSERFSFFPLYKRLKVTLLNWKCSTTNMCRNPDFPIDLLYEYNIHTKTYKYRVFPPTSPFFVLLVQHTRIRHYFFFTRVALNTYKTQHAQPLRHRSIMRTGILPSLRALESPLDYMYRENLARGHIPGIFRATAAAEKKGDYARTTGDARISLRTALEKKRRRRRRSLRLYRRDSRVCLPR